MMRIEESLTIMASSMFGNVFIWFCFLVLWVVVLLLGGLGGGV